MVTFDVRDQNNQYFTGNMLEMMLALLPESGVSAVTDIYIDYIGFFATEQQATQ